MIVRFKLLVAVVLLLPQWGSAGVYMCVDPATGKTSFTDKACAVTDAREEVRIDATNLDSGRNTQGRVVEKSWRSEEDTRKSGRDYNASRRNLYNNNATASTGNAAK